MRPMPIIDEPLGLWSPDRDGLDVAELPRGFGRAPIGRTGAIACVIGSDANGVLISTFGPRRIAVGYDGDSVLRGLVAQPAMVNLAPSTFDSGAWAALGATITNAAVIGPDGYKTAALISGTNVQGYLLSPLTLGAAGTIYVQAILWAAAAHSVRLEIQDANGATVATVDRAVTTTRQPYALSFTWSGATAGIGRLLVCGSNTGSAQTAYLSPLVYVGATRSWPGVIPIGSPGATVPTLDVSALVERVNREGELTVDLHASDVGTRSLATLRNATNANDKRELRLATGPVVGDHATGSGVSESATIAVPTIDTSERWTAKLRWQRAGLVDGVASSFSSVRAEQGASVNTATGRSATWTASTVPVSKLDVGHDDGADVATGIVFGVTVKTREPRL